MSVKRCLSTHSDRGTVLRRPFEISDGRLSPAERKADHGCLEKNLRLSWKYRALNFAVNLLFLPAMAVKDLLERRPGGLRR